MTILFIFVLAVMFGVVFYLFFMPRKKKKMKIINRKSDQGETDAEVRIINEDLFVVDGTVVLKKIPYSDDVCVFNLTHALPDTVFPAIDDLGFLKYFFITDENSSNETYSYVRENSRDTFRRFSQRFENDNFLNAYRKSYPVRWSTIKRKKLGYALVGERSFTDPIFSLIQKGKGNADNDILDVSSRRVWKRFGGIIPYKHEGEYCFELPMPNGVGLIFQNGYFEKSIRKSFRKVRDSFIVQQRRNILSKNVIVPRERNSFLRFLMGEKLSRLKFLVAGGNVYTDNCAFHAKKFFRKIM